MIKTEKQAKALTAVLLLIIYINIHSPAIRIRLQELIFLVAILYINAYHTK